MSEDARQRAEPQPGSDDETAFEREWRRDIGIAGEAFEDAARAWADRFGVMLLRLRYEEEVWLFATRCYVFTVEALVDNGGRIEQTVLHGAIGDQSEVVEAPWACWPCASAPRKAERPHRMVRR